MGVLVLLLGGAALALAVLITVPLGGQISAPVAIVGGFVLMIVFHWVSWGWWLGPMIQQEQQTLRSDSSGDSE